MTVVARRVKTVFLTYGVVVVEDTSVDLVAADTHTFLEDVTVIGALLRSTLMDDLAGWDSGRFTVLSELSRVAVLQDPGTIIAFCNHLICREATVGINATQTMVGTPEERQAIMFPAGYGIDMNEDSNLYLNLSTRNGMANPHRISIGCIVYYVER